MTKGEEVGEVREVVEATAPGEEDRLEETDVFRFVR